MAQPRTKPRSGRQTPVPSDALAGFGHQLRKARTDQGMTLRDLSEESGVSIAYLSDLERGVLANPTLDTLRAVAKALHVSLNDLLGVEDSPAGPMRYPKPLNEFRALTPFREVVAEDAKRRSRHPGDVEDEWLRTLAGVHVGGRRPRTASDYLFVFEAIRRAVERR